MIAPDSLTAAEADREMERALIAAADALSAREVAMAELSEEDLRRAIFDALTTRFPGLVRKERTLLLDDFQGVGGVDVLVDRVPGQRVAWLAEVKWSYTRRPKIFESLWDAIKLCLCQEQHGATRTWLIAGAPDEQWATAEAIELFRDGEVPVRALWDHPLDPPGPNGGTSIGKDLLAGGRGNYFTRAPNRLIINALAPQPIAGFGWTIRAAAVSPAGGWEIYGAKPKFPARIDQRWLIANVAGLDDDTYGALLQRLRDKRWTETELETRVYPLRRPR